MNNPYHPSQFSGPFGTITNKGITVEQYYALEMWKEMFRSGKYNIALEAKSMCYIAAYHAKVLERELPNVSPTIHKHDKDIEPMPFKQDELPIMGSPKGSDSGDAEKVWKE